jgi:hypothetical protein
MVLLLHKDGLTKLMLKMNLKTYLTCWVVHTTNKMRFCSDDWIYFR